MPQKLPVSRRMSTAARWPVGVALTSWRYLWRTVPLHRVEEAGDPASDRPPALAAEVALDEIQRHEHGVGPLFHRRYRTRIRDARLTAEELVARVAADPDCASPTEFASFVKLRGEEGEMRVGDEYRVRMAGPWDGPVRVVERTPTSFRLVTLDGHLEAGQIRFTALQQDPVIVFEIESWARSAGPTVHLLYDRMRMAKEIQLHMWTSMLQRIAEVAGGRVTGGIDIHTRRVIEPETAGLADRVAALRDRPLNFDPGGPHRETDGWRRDLYQETLPSEPPGPPIEGGAFQIAQTLLCDYKFADPSIVRAYYRHNTPLEGRNMLLEFRVGPFRTYGCCRVGRVIDEERTVDGRPVRVWGWPYQTLQGHIEQGEMSWEVWKWLDTGEVQFRVHSYSRLINSSNPFTTIGVRLFAQRQRDRFLTSAGRRVRELADVALQGAASRAGSDTGASGL
ncbi:MAG TPA: DUF1990 family protein [Conexibacter sp.]|jgi:uncharacterized protein (UPF0548 family)